MNLLALKLNLLAQVDQLLRPYASLWTLLLQSRISCVFSRARREEENHVRSTAVPCKIWKLAVIALTAVLLAWNDLKEQHKDDGLLCRDLLEHSWRLRQREDVIWGSSLGMEGPCSWQARNAWRFGGCSEAAEKRRIGQDLCLLMSRSCRSRGQTSL